jgi:AraC-like DNA-binding protein
MSALFPNAIRRNTPADIQVPEGGIRMLESQHEHDFHMEMSHWPFHKLCWVAMGCGEVISDDDHSPIQKGTFLLLPAHWRHRFQDEVKDPLTLVMFCVSDVFFARTSAPHIPSIWDALVREHGRGVPLRASTTFHHSLFVAGFRGALREQGRKEAGWESVLRSEFNLLLVRMTRGGLTLQSEPAPGSMQTVKGAIDHLDAHPDAPYRLDDLAERCGLSARRFTDLFKQLTGVTFSTYLNQRRIAYACQRLDETGHILYACHESGFNDLAYFYRVFKKVKGLTPGQYLKS